jgi:hypothetical protein
MKHGLASIKYHIKSNHIREIYVASIGHYNTVLACGKLAQWFDTISSKQTPSFIWQQKFIFHSTMSCYGRMKMAINKPVGFTASHTCLCVIKVTIRACKWNSQHFRQQQTSNLRKHIFHTHTHTHRHTHTHTDRQTHTHTHTHRHTHTDTQLRTGLLKMTVGVLTTCHTQYPWDREYAVAPMDQETLKDLFYDVRCVVVTHFSAWSAVYLHGGEPPLKPSNLTCYKVWNELDCRVDVCRITKSAHIEHL